MKVLLTQDVKGKGKAGDIINANDGYARNFLIPRGLAVAADANNIHAANLKKQADVHRREVARQNARALADEMKGLTVKVYAKAGSGKLFGSIGAAEIAEALKEQYGIDVDKKAHKAGGAHKVPGHNRYNRPPLRADRYQVQGRGAASGGK